MFVASPSRFVAAVAQARRGLLSEGATAPPNRASIEEAVADLDATVLRELGYDLGEDTRDLYYGEILDRRCCILYYALRSAIVNPNWYRPGAG